MLQEELNLQERARNATTASVDDGSEEGWPGRVLQPNYISSFAIRCCHEERGGG